MGSSNYRLNVGGIEVDVVIKNIKNINLMIYKSDGRVRVSTPQRVNKEIIQKFINHKIKWIKKQLKRIEEQFPKPDLKYESGETHDLFGEPLQLIVLEKSVKPNVKVRDKRIIELSVRPGSSIEIRERVMREWYREELKKRIPALIKKWEERLGVTVREWNVKKMKTRWGTCNTRASRIWLSLELAKQPIEHLDYVVLHEIAHLIERSHNAKFKSILSEQMPHWRTIQQIMNGAGTLKR